MDKVQFSELSSQDNVSFSFFVRRISYIHVANVGVEE